MMFIRPAAERQALSTAALNPLVEQPYDFGLGFGQAFDDMRARLLSDSARRMKRAAYDDYIDDLQRLTGQRLSNPVPIMDQRWDDRLVNGDLEEQRLGEFHASLAKLAERHPGIPIKDRAQMLAELSARVQHLKQEAEGGVNVGWGDAGRFAGTLAGAMTDPVNAAGLLFGGVGAARTAATTLMGRLANVGRVAATEAAVNAGTQVAIEPSVARFNQEMGVDYGLKDSAEAVGMAALGGGLLGGAGEGVFQGVRPLLKNWSAAKAQGHVPTPVERGAELALEHQARVIDDNPFPGGLGENAHVSAMARADAQIAAGQPVDVRAEVEDLQKALRAVEVEPTGPAFHPLVVLQANDIGNVMVARGGFRNINQLEITRQGWGLVKVIWGHGWRSAEPDYLKVTEADVLAMPEILKTKRPIPEARGDDFATWVVERDGRKVLYGAKKIDGQDDHTLLTIHVINPDGPTPHIPLSDDYAGARAASQVQGSSLPLDTARPSSQSLAGGQADAPATASIAPNGAKAKAALPPPELREPKRPQTLAGFLAKRGLADDDGWLKHAGIDHKRLPGLLKKDGLSSDDAARAAWEEGFFPEFRERPTPDQLHEALLDELAGNAGRVRPDDEAILQDWLAWKSNMDELDRHGVDPGGKSLQEIGRELDAKRFRARPPVSDAEVAHWMTRSADDDFDVDGALAEFDRAQAEGGDLWLPASGMADDGSQALVRASDILADFDRELDAWDAAAFCLGK